MSRYPLAKHYEQLVPRERLQLLLSAEGRRDHAEVDRLKESCPRHLYRLRDVAFTDRLAAMSQLNLAILGDIHALLAEYRMVQRLCGSMKPFMKLAAMETERAVMTEAVECATPPAVPTMVQPAALEPEEPRSDYSDASDLDSFWRQMLPETTTAIERLRQHLSAGIASHLNGILSGYERFCRSLLDMSAVEVLRTFDPTISTELELVKEEQHDSDQAAHIEQLLRNFWLG
jgi:hypothetical protein